MVMVSPGRLMAGRGGSVGTAGRAGSAGRVGRPPPPSKSRPTVMASRRSSGGNVGSPIAGRVGSPIAGRVKLAGSLVHVVVVFLLPLTQR